MRSWRSSLISAGKLLHSWHDGSEGFDWKSRDLSERRATALDTLLNVGKRRLINDSVRDRCKRNVERLRHDDVSVNIEQCSPASTSRDDELLQGIEELLSSEEVADMMTFVPESELKFLQDELYASSLGETDAIKRWMKLRSQRESNFSSLPKEERTMWSAWYLRDVGSGR